MEKIVSIDCLPESAPRYRDGWAVVAIDVIRATTLAVTAVAMGRAYYPADSVEAALELARRLRDPLLAGEIAGEVPPGFHMNNSPAELAERRDVSRPLISLSSSGTRLIVNARGCHVLYLACFRNSSATSARLIREGHAKVALLGAGSLGEFREEDQICCAWIAKKMVRAGYVPHNGATLQVLDRWANAKPGDCLASRSIDYLKRTGQLSDLRFILEKIDDIGEAFTLQAAEFSENTPHVSRNHRATSLAA